MEMEKEHDKQTPLSGRPVILCVDDEQCILDIVYCQLQHHFGDAYEYEFSESAEEALEIVNELTTQGHEIAMVITDQLMPGMKGEQLLIKLYNLYPNIVTILLTGQASVDSTINIINNTNLFRYLTKPRDEKELLLAVERGIKQFNLGATNQQQLGVFRKFVPDQFLKILSKDNIVDVQLGDSVRREMTVLFADIKGFTALSERMSPEENFKFINLFLKYIEPPIVNHNGFVDKYIGDAILALFNKPNEAIDACIEMQKAIEKFNGLKIKEGSKPIEVGIGVHTGELMLGIVGVADRMQSTVISDTVNLSSRLQALAFLYDAAVIVSDPLLNKLENKEKYNFRFLGKILVSGKINEVDVYELLDINDSEIYLKKIETKAEFEEGLHFYFEKKFAEASVKFNSVLELNPGDKLVQYYLKKSAFYMIQGVPEDWAGVEIMPKYDKREIMK